MPRALITGITGQDGQYLAELLREKGYDVFGLVTGQREKKVDELVENYPYVQPLSGDLRDMSSLISALEQSQPDEVYNLGAISFVALSFKQPELTAEVTGLGVLRMLEAIRIVGGAENNPIRFYQASSSEMFGKVRESPQTEATHFHPRSPYGVAKAFGHSITVNYRESYGMFASSGILFNHESVPEYTPVVVRRSGVIDICPIGELIPHPETPDEGTESTFAGGNLEVWDGDQWSRCTARTAYWHSGRSITIHGRGGIVECTPEHVLILPTSEMAAKEIKAGDRILLAAQPPVPSVTTLTTEEASLLGVLAAEGSILPDGQTRVTCHDESLLLDATLWWERVTGGQCSKYEGAESPFSGRRTPTIRLLGNRPYLRALRSELYTRDGKKRVPIRILNADPNLQLAFLSAYNRGDGLRAGRGIDEFKSFRTTSPTLAAGLVWMARGVLGREVSVYLQPGALGGGSSYLVNLTSGRVHGRKGAHLRRPKDEVRRVDQGPFAGWMCDLATESGRFAAGVGFVVVHNSPRRGPEFLPRKISQTVARISLGLQNELAVGNLDSRRDWGFAGDYVEAMWMMLQQPEPDDYVVATGETHSGREFAELAFGHVGITDWERYVRIDPRHFRPAEVDHLIGDASKAKRVLGWQPKVGFNELVALMVDADLKAEQGRV